MKYGVGIDISKGKSTISIMSQVGELIEEPFEVDHTNEGMEILEQKLSKIPKEDLKIVMEDTGTYHLPILGYLLEKDYFVTTENALRLKKYFDRGLRKIKTDKKDAIKLAEYACENWYKLNKVSSTDRIYAELRFLSRQYLTKISVQTKLKVDFCNLCDLVFPGYNKLLRDNNYILGLEVFKKYYHPELVLKKSISEFIKDVDKIAKKLGHRNAGITLAKKIYSLAKSTISPRPNNKYSQLACTSCIDILISIIKTSNTIITEMNKLARELPEYEVIKEIPGIGERLVCKIIAEVGDIRRFKNAGSLIAYAGLDSPPYQSGQYEARIRHISKRGNKYLRKIGYEIIMSIRMVCTTGTELYDYIIKKEEEGKPKRVAKIAGLNKFLRMYYGKVKAIYKKLETN